jgi:DNA-binding MarR family transcriptional regulator
MIRAMTTFDLDDFLPYQLSVLSNRLSRGFADIYGKEFGITQPEWRVVAHLNHTGSVSVREIHARVDMDKSKVSRAATRLQAAGFITKETSSTDRRLVALTLTPKGRAMMACITPIAHAYEREVLAGLDAVDGKALKDTLRQMLKETT